MYFNKLSLSFMIGAVLLTQQALADKHTTTDKQPVAEKQESSIAGFKSNDDAISYTIGASIGRNFKKEGIAINQKIFVEGFNEAMSGSKLKISEKEFKAILAGFQVDMRRKMATNQKERSIQNQKKADEFLAENTKKDGIVTLPSGVQYKILKEGTGEKPMDSDIVEVNYRGTLLDGTEFDANVAGKPVNLKIPQLIAGWKEAIKLMPVGSKWQLFIPPKSAYGERGVGASIGPNEMLIFEVELLSIKK